MKELLYIQNKLIVERYLEELMTGKFDSYYGTSKPKAKYITFDERKGQYQAEIRKLDLTGREGFIEKQKLAIGRYLKERKINGKVLTLVREVVKANMEYELYATDHSLEVLKDIAKSIDIVKYWVFLRSEQLELRKIKRTQLPYYGKVTIELIEVLYDVLITNHFIHPDTELEDLLNVFIKDDSTYGRIRWIDDYGAKNKKVRTITLLILAEAFFVDINHQTQFLCRHFAINKLDMYGRNRETKPVDVKVRHVARARQTDRESARVKFMTDILKDIQFYTEAK